MDPATGEVLDFVGGRDDLRAGIVRAIGDPRLRFTEDKLRMLRARAVRRALWFPDRAGNDGGGSEPGRANHSGFARTNSR